MMSARVVLPLAFLAACKGRAEAEACGATVAGTRDLDSNLVQLTAAARPQIDAAGLANSSESSTCPQFDNDECLKEGSTTDSYFQGAQWARCSYATETVAATWPDGSATYHLCVQFPRDFLKCCSLTCNAPYLTEAACDALEPYSCYVGNHWQTCNPATGRGSECLYPHTGPNGVASYSCGAAATPTPAAATGDPHLQNVHGERFDLMNPGKHVLVNIPRGERAESALLRVEAEASKLGGLCEDIYFTGLNITGSWAYAEQAGGYQFASEDSVPESHKWIALGRIELKVVHAHTATGTHYLNFYIKHLGRAGFVVGGLLGEDDHVIESTPSAACVQHASLKKHPLPLYSRSSAASIAEGTFA